jgi:hypothetical protein
MVCGLIACASPSDDKAGATPGAPNASSSDGGVSATNPTSGACAAAASASSCAAGKAVLSPATSYPNVIELLSYVGSGDITGDGKNDVVTAVRGSGTRGVDVLVSKGDGTFGTPIHTAMTFAGYDFVVRDFNGDCKADLLVPSKVGDTTAVAIHLLVSNGDGTFQKPIVTEMGNDSEITNLVAADFNGDGKLDFAAYSFLSSTSGPGIKVALGTANGFSAPTTFQKQLHAANSPAKSDRSIAAGDVNGDGKPDLVLATPGEGACVAMNDGQGGFTADVVCYAPTAKYAGDSVAIGDVNGDGKPDVVLGLGQSVTSDPGSLIDVFLNKGDGTFAAPVSVAYPESFYGPVTLVDLNNDKALDLAVYYGGSPLLPTAQISVYYNDGKGKFPAAPSSIIGVKQGISAPAFGDFLGNGLNGIVAASTGADLKSDINVVTSTCKP